MHLKSILISLTFILFLVQFKLYDEWNSKLSELELAGIRYSVTVNGIKSNKILYQFNQSNKYFLTNSATELTSAFINMMSLLDLSNEEKKSYLTELRKYESNQLNSIPKYESFEADFNISVGRFNEEHYEPKVSRLKTLKNLSGYSIITLTFLLALLNLIKEKKDANKH